jgi:streptogramin lyase
MLFAPSARLYQHALCATATILSLLLAGCALGGNGSSTATQSAVPQLKINGSVFGGQQPVIGSTIQLYTVGTTGVGSASTPLISATVLTGAQGQFAITGDYSCTSATQVYLTATGGNAGSGTNTSLTLMAALGSCSTLLANASTTYISMNELTTVAAAFALAPFMVDYTHIGAAGTNPTGLVNAFGAATSLVNLASGAVPPSLGGVTLPTARINTLGNILAACVNTAGASSSQCTTLFSTTGATETIGAALAIARNPGAAAYTALYSLGGASAPFVPGVSAQPNDFTLAVNYTGTELASPYAIAIDASGNAWISNESGFSIVKLAHLGSTFSSTSFTGNGSILAPRGLSIDRSGNVWIANTGGNDIVELSNAGAVLSANGFTGGGLSAPVAIANDSAGNAWIANLTGNSITELSAAGVASGASPITGAGSLSAPTAIAIDATGRLLVANAGTGTYCTFTSAAVLQSCPGDGTLFGATGIAVNSTTVAMSGSTTGTTVSGAFTLATNAGAVNAGSPLAGGGLTLPTAVALDGSSNIWLANSASLSEFSGTTAIAPTSGYGTLSNPNSLAIDASGNVWTANSGDNSISIFVGVASPVATPLALNVGP